jgi:ribonucleoside-triphosphate reductase
MKMLQVQKRDGRIVEFNEQKIMNAILAAFKEVDGEINEYAQTKAENIASYIRGYYEDVEEIPNIEEIQDLVEKGLMSTKRKDVAKAYILYRENRTKARGNIIDKEVLEFLDGASEYWNTENSNKNAQIVTTQRDYLAGILSTDIARRVILPKEVVEAHDAGIIHEHDMDYLSQNALTNCCLINLNDMLQNGTVINGIMIEKPHKLLTATTIATQIILGVSSSQYGGCSVSLAHLAPFVRDSYNYYYNKYMRRTNNEPLSETFAMEDLKKEIEAGVQTFNYQVNSMTNTNGQSPFLTVFMYLGETEEFKDELAMLIEEFLKQRIEGMKNEVGAYITVAFPKLIYVLEEDNINEDSKYWELTKLAAKCTAKRLVPDYISEKMMKKIKINKYGKGDCFAVMGCRSALSPWSVEGNPSKAKDYVEGEGKYYGRFNCGVTTINLPDVAFSSKGNYDKFWELMEERTELCHKGLQARIKRLLNVTSDIAPILWQHGAYARLEKGEKLTNLIYGGYSTASLGYAGLYECTKYMTGKSHTDGAEGEKFALEVMQFLNKKCNQWKEAENIGYSIYGSPIESTTYKFAKCLKKRFGEDIFIKLDGKDRNYITNSFHVPVFEAIDPFTKLSIEAKFQELSSGGMISYVESADMSRNTEALLEVMKFIYNNIMYAEINTKSDYCQVCGYDGEVKIVDIDGKLDWECPQCGNMDHNKMNVARRVCGYISTNFFNQGRTDEINNRYVHLDNHQLGE